MSTGAIESWVIQLAVIALRWSPAREPMSASALGIFQVTLFSSSSSRGMTSMVWPSARRLAPRFERRCAHRSADTARSTSKRTMPAWLTEHQHAVVAAAADRLLPPRDDHPGGAALGVADYIDGLLGAFTFDPPRIWAGGPFSGRAGGDARASSEFLALSRARGARVADAHRGIARHSRARAQRSGGRLAGAVPRRDSPRSATTSPTSTGEEQDARLDAVADVQGAALHARVRGRVRRARVRRQPRRARLALRSGSTGDVQPRGYTDVEVAGRDVTVDCDAVIVGTGPAGATAAEVLTAAGWSVDHAREGPQPPARRSIRRSRRSAT